MRKAPQWLDQAARHLRAGYRALVPCPRRRRHLVLVMQEEYRSENTSALLHRYLVLAVVRPEEREVLRPLVQRLSATRPSLRTEAALGLKLHPERIGQHMVAHLRTAIAEDGFVDGSELWSGGARVDDLVGAAPAPAPAPAEDGEVDGE